MNVATEPDEILCDSQHERFRTRVVVGTLIGVMTCLLFALLLMLIIWQPQAGGFAGAGSGSGAGSGNGTREGPGTCDANSSDANASGNDNATAAGMTESSTEASSGNDNLKTGGDPSAAEIGTAESGVTEKSSTEPLPAKGTGVDDSKKPLAQTFVVPAIDEMQAQRGADEGAETPTAASPPGMFAGRNADQRKKLAESEGGSESSEAAVENGLKWLAKHQDKDGRWSLHNFNAAGDCNGQCSMTGTNSDAAGTGFGLLPFLGAGYTHKGGKYQTTVRKSLDWLIQDQNKDGSFRSTGGGNMYAHGIASLALCEAYAMTKDPSLKTPAQRAIDFIVRAQHAQGGWRYSPGMAGDTSVTGWQVIALRSAQQGGLRFPKDVLPKVAQYLDSVQTDKKGAGYRYMPGGSITDAMVAEGLLCRIYTSWNSKRPGLDAGVQYLLTHPPRNGGELYYWYYASQVMHHYGGDAWHEWNTQMRDLLLNLQSKEGHESGSWAPQGGHDRSGGRVYATSLALLTLEVYYRHKRELQ